MDFERGTSYPNRLNKKFTSKFPEVYQDQQTLEVGQSSQWPKCDN